LYARQTARAYRSFIIIIVIIQVCDASFICVEMTWMAWQWQTFFGALLPSTPLPSGCPSPERKKAKASSTEPGGGGNSNNQLHQTPPSANLSKKELGDVLAGLHQLNGTFASIHAILQTIQRSLADGKVQ